jgi:branched-chain amino acid transport system substrate-binding protein
MEIVRCVSGGEPGKSTDCANQMVAEKVAAVLLGSNQFTLNIWQILHTAGIPVFIFATGNPDLLADPTSTFVFGTGSASTTGLAIGAAKNAKPKAKKVTVIAIDVPAATQLYKTTAPATFKEAGLDMELVPVAAGTADMTPQMQRVVATNPDGVVLILGNDSFCIAAFNGLRTAGFKGTVTAVPQCLSDATRTAVPADFLEGIQISATAPVDNPKDPSIKQYYAVLDKYGASDVDRSNTVGMAMFNTMGAFGAALKGLKGDVTSASVLSTIKGMDWTVVPGTGGLHFRCSGKADPTQPAVCSNATNAATLDAKGVAASYTPVNDAEIPA